MAANERKDDLEPGQIRYTDGNGNYATGYEKDGYVYTDKDYTTPIPTGSVVHTDNGYYRKGNYGSYAMGTAPDYKDQMQGFMQQIINRKPFEFDLNNDPLYQQYRDQYTKLGKLAMEDTMGQAAGLTGGYGSTYAENAGQQAYHAYLDRLNDVVPDIYAKQRSDYDTATNELYNRYSVTSNAYQAEREAAVEELTAIIAAGGTPSDELIEAAGLSQDYVDAMKTYYLYGAGGSSASGNGTGNGQGKGQTPPETPPAYEYTENELMSLYNDFLSGKLSQDDLDKYVADYAAKNGMSNAEVWKMLGQSVDSNSGNSLWSDDDISVAGGFRYNIRPHEMLVGLE